MSAQSNQEIRVTLGVKLPDETVKRIAQAVQRAVLVELAGTDLKVSNLSVRFLGPGTGGGGGTQGIHIEASE